MAPPMTLISPANASKDALTAPRGGLTYELHIHGNVYGIDELAEAMEGAMDRRRRAYGMAS